MGGMRHILLVWVVMTIVLLSCVLYFSFRMSSDDVTATAESVKNAAASLFSDSTSEIASTAEQIDTITNDATNPYNTATSPLVKTALKYVGNQGGKRFWSWYGFSSHVAWCACFVSWCANQNGYISSGLVPKDSFVPTMRNWFQTRSRYRSRGSYVPEAGDIIFFSWDGGRSASHVGIVAGVKKGRVYTVEGNRKDRCVKADYSLKNKTILGYGTVAEP